MAPAVFTALLVASTAEVVTLTGQVRVAGSAPAQQVMLLAGERATVLTGDPLVELRRLGSATVEVVGTWSNTVLWVRDYRILEVNGAQKPLVGTLVESGASLALSDGRGAPVLLSLTPNRRQRLSDKVGAKIWVHGPRLVSGELSVTKYGVLREAEPAQPNESKQSGNSNDGSNKEQEP